MIHKLLLSLASAATVIALLLCWKNRGALMEVREQKSKLNAQIEKKVSEITALKEEVVSVEEARLAAEQQRAQRQSELEEVERKHNAAKTEEARVQGIYDTTKAEYDRLAAELEKLPEGVNPETLGQDIDRLEVTLADRTAELDSLTRSLEIADGTLDKRRQALESQQERKRQRLVGYQVNSLEARITAVDPVWGFVVVNAGSTQGLTPESALMVVDEANRPVGDLNIVELEGGSTVANFKTMGHGKSRGVEPGDKVILRRLNQ